MSTQENNPKRINPKQLLEIFHRQTVLAKEFLHLLKEEKAALIDMNMQALITLTSKKESQLLRLQKLDEALQEESRRLCPENKEKIIRLAALTPFVSDEESKRLVDLRSQLTELRAEIDEKNLFNKQFAEDTSKYLDDAIKMITNAVSEHITYSTKGAPRQAASQANLLSREV